MLQAAWTTTRLKPHAIDDNKGNPPSRSQSCPTYNMQQDNFYFVFISDQMPTWTARNYENSEVMRNSSSLTKGSHGFPPHMVTVIAGGTSDWGPLRPLRPLTTAFCILEMTGIILYQLTHPVGSILSQASGLSLSVALVRWPWVAQLDGPTPRHTRGHPCIAPPVQTWRRVSTRTLFSSRSSGGF